MQMKTTSAWLCLKLSVALFVMSHATAVHAVLVTGGNLVSPPPSVLVGVQEQPVVAFKGAPIVFPEVLNGTVPVGGMKVDHDGTDVVTDPVVTSGEVSALLKDTVIGAGTEYSSYFFHFDPVGAPGFAYYVTEIVFDAKIIGVQLFSKNDVLTKPIGTPYTGTLELGDAIAILNGSSTAYPTNSFRGLEEDSFQLAVSGNKAIIAGSVSGVQIDQIRFIVAAVPEFASAITWGGVSLVAAGFISSRRRKSA
jgi:hypothetical protein